MKLSKDFLFGILIGLLVESLLIALRYENQLMAREAILFMMDGINPFWMFPIINIFLILIAILLFSGKDHKKLESEPEK